MDPVDADGHRWRAGARGDGPEWRQPCRSPERHAVPDRVGHGDVLSVEGGRVVSPVGLEPTGLGLYRPKCLKFQLSDHSQLGTPGTREHILERILCPKSSPPVDRDFRSRGRQNRASLPEPASVIQKLTPSLQAPNGEVLEPVAKDPSVVRSAAFQSETLLLPPLVTSTRSPSNAATAGPFRPLPISVCRTAPFEARTTETELELLLGTQMFVPSKTGICGVLPTVTVWRMAPAESSFKSVPALASVTQTLAPS